MVKKLYSGLKKFGGNVYSGIKTEYKCHKLALDEIGSEFLDDWDFSKKYYREGFKKFKKKTSDNIGKIVAVPAGALTVLTAYRGFSDIFDYECTLPVLSRMEPGECKKYALSLLAIFLGGLYHDSKMKRTRAEAEAEMREYSSRIDSLLERLARADERFKIEIDKHDKKRAEETERLEESRRRLKYEVKELRGRVSEGNVKMEELSLELRKYERQMGKYESKIDKLFECIENQDREMKRLKKDSELQIELLEKLSKKSVEEKRKAAN